MARLLNGCKFVGCVFLGSKRATSESGFNIQLATAFLPDHVMSPKEKETTTYRSIAVRLSVAADTASSTATLQTDTTNADYSLTTQH